ncbi:hypothetical protein AB0A63_00275 [Lentzea sp. NPDC042327]|uniref:hypothetical protein n=1 Tax=Lentzea sp. NPDC042327 TaxID=3154801 RepID=UPI0033E2B951
MITTVLSIYAWQRYLPLRTSSPSGHIESRPIALLSRSIFSARNGRDDFTGRRWHQQTEEHPMAQSIIANRQRIAYSEDGVPSPKTRRSELPRPHYCADRPANYRTMNSSPLEPWTRMMSTIWRDHITEDDLACLMRHPGRR